MDAMNVAKGQVVPALDIISQKIEYLETRLEVLLASQLSVARPALHGPAVTRQALLIENYAEL
jgi:hypothetical protein